MTLLLEGIVGSKAYGLDTPDSDTDKLGVFIAPTEDVVSLDWYSHKETKHSTDPDITHHELGKFCRLALRCNPTVTELLWLDEYTVESDHGFELIHLRDKFLSKGYVRNAYGGYAKQQLNKYIRRGNQTFSSETKNRTAKHARHIIRLLYQGTQLLTEGQLTVALSAGIVKDCREISELAISDPTAFIEWFDIADMYFQNRAEHNSVLPDEPDFQTINNWLVSMRKAYF